MNNFVCHLKRNIFLTKNDVVKIGDLGVAKLIEKSTIAKTYIGTRLYMSPELEKCLENQNQYTFVTDVW